MNVVIIFAVSILTVFLAGRLARRTAFTRADVALGIIAGVLGLGLEQLLVSQNLATSNLGLPLVAAIVAALGLASQRRDTAQ